MNLQLRFHTRARIPSWASVPPLTTTALMSTVTGAAVRSILVHPNGGFEVVLDLRRGSPDDALRDLIVALEQLGFDIAEAVIIELATAVVEGAVIGALFGTAAGSSSQNAHVILACAAIGAAVGVVIGNLVSVAGATYTASRQASPAGSWSIAPLSTQRGPAAA